MPQEGTFCVHTIGSRPKLVVSADGRGVVSHAGSRLLADLADATGLTGSFAEALHRLRPRGTGHDPGRVAVDLAVMLAGGEAIADLALLRDQREVFGPVASAPTAWRVMADIDATTLAALRTVRAADLRAQADAYRLAAAAWCPRHLRSRLGWTLVEVGLRLAAAPKAAAAIPYPGST
ncbi:transposase [Streptomyces sp. NPDC049910]|uniref:transposase n=1 Tax=Streptomyces sp. NPDC049910 TaxID=3155278 RepID=UPI003421E3B9